MDDRLQALIDRFEIIDVLNTYCHGCDRLDEAEMASTYHADSWDDHGAAKCPGPEFARRVCASLPTTSKMCAHQLGQSTIRINGDHAGAETYFIATLRVELDGTEYVDQMGGRYVDKFERRNGQWKIKDRICIREWSIRFPLVSDWLAGQPFVEGQRSRLDPSYGVLGLT